MVQRSRRMEHPQCRRGKCNGACAHGELITIAMAMSVKFIIDAGILKVMNDFGILAGLET